MNTLTADPKEIASYVPTRRGGARSWQRWTPYAAVAWSLIYAALGVYWAVSGRGFPYGSETPSDVLGMEAERFGLGVAWIVVMMAGIPAAAMGAAMLRGVRGRMLRPLFITAGALLSGVLLLLMTSLNQLAMLAYIPFMTFKLLTGADIGFYLQEITQWIFLHQLLCLSGGFLWLGATVTYARRSGDACVYCGRRDGPEGWTSPGKARRWGRIAVYMAMAVPIVYAVTRYAWALGIPLGLSNEALRRGQESGEWISGLFLANVGLVGAILMLGLVQRWGEVFPRWMIGLAGRPVPIALAVIPAAIMSVLFIVSGITAWAGWTQMAAAAAESGLDMGIVVGPLGLFPIWGAALAVATLGYYYRRRGPCGVCGRGVPVKTEETLDSYDPRIPATM